MTHHAHSGDPIAKTFARIESVIERMELRLFQARRTVEELMADKQAVFNEISALRDLITQDNLRDQQAMDQISAVNQSLRAQIVDLQKNHGTDPADFDDILSQLDGVKTLIQPVNVNEALQNASASAQSTDTTSTASISTSTGTTDATNEASVNETSGTATPSDQPTNG